jgi:S-adenosylmethionine hydrolase
VAGATRNGPNIVALLTDFGTGSVYVGAMKGVIATISPRTAVLDVTHGVAPQAVDEGAFLLAATCRSFPEGTVFAAVVDPGVGSAREAVLVEAGGRMFVAPDNGLLGRVIERERASGGVRAWYVRERRLFLSEVSNTFHGRDVFAPVAARLASGQIEAGDVGPEAPLESLVALERSGTWVGKVV